MAKMWKCQVKQEYRWATVQVGGRPFTKVEAVELNEDQITDEIINSPLLDVEETDDERKPSRKTSRRKARASNDKDD